MIQTFGFSFVIEGLKEGRSFARNGWNGKDLFITLQQPTELSKMTKKYVFISGKEEGIQFLVPWTPSQTDMMADDWYEVE